MYWIDYDNVEIEGQSKQNCLAMADWSAPEGDDTSYGSFIITSGVRYVELTSYDTTTGEEPFTYDLDTQKWDVIYRAPEAVPETEVQIQGQQTSNSTVEITDASGSVVNATMGQSVYIGYEIVEDIDSDNVLGMMMQLDVPADILTNGTIIYQYVQYRK